MKLDKLLTFAALGIASLLGIVFLVDAIVGIPFGRFSIMTDVVVVAAAGLIIWQCIETLRELR